jgi:hypothetical protein
LTTAGQLRNAGVYVPAHVPDYEVVDAVTFTSHGMVRPAVEEIAQRVVELMRAAPAIPSTGSMLTLAEAIAYTKRPSAWAFYKWARLWRVKSKTRGRYSRQDLDRALERESGLTHTPATLRRHQETINAGRLAA